jgi:hypothetical protein
MQGGANWLFKRLGCLAAAAMMIVAALPAVNAEDVLRGGVEEENYRLAHPTGTPQKGRTGDGLRLNRAPMQGSAIDSTAFAGGPQAPSGAPLNGNVNSNDFAQPPKNFDIGADRGSREMVLAWERWHHQLSQAIYERWQRVAQDPGKATIRVTVTRDHHISAQVLNCNGAPSFQGEIMLAINSLEGNPGLTFPLKSERQQVSFEADYIAATDVKPGFSWVKNDYEHVKDQY